jgi:regulator of extracellular matrix RemA (YlzA/DUF370 family)
MNRTFERVRRAAAEASGMLFAVLGRREAAVIFEDGNKIAQIIKSYL